MEIIHEAKTKGDYGKRANLSFLFIGQPGVYNKFIDSIEFFNLPNPYEKSTTLQNRLFLPNILLSSDEDELSIMQPFSFYTYQGSMSQPPCAENTIRFIASDPIKSSITALDMFKEALREPDMQDANGRIYPAKPVLLDNNRGIQSLNGRAVFHYDFQKFDPQVFKTSSTVDNNDYKKNGHYEKQDKVVYNYIFVNQDQPSGIPGALVVQKKDAKGK